jgi:hypothetical protein
VEMNILSIKCLKTRTNFFSVIGAHVTQWFFFIWAFHFLKQPPILSFNVDTWQAVFFFPHICDIKILANFAPNSKIGLNYTRKTRFSKISLIFLVKKSKNSLQRKTLLISTIRKEKGNENWSRSLVFQLGKSRSLRLYPTQIFNKRRPCSRRWRHWCQV